jgi:photosystem II stability/assembly factor-like uncharacterized protein
MYASGEGGLYKTTNDADSWSIVLPTDESPIAIAISPADPNVLYLALSDHPGRDAKKLRLLRTRDAGTSWDVLEELASNCLNNTQGLQPHPTDPARIFRNQTCNPGGSVSGTLAESRDYGSTWTKLNSPDGFFPARIAGGEGVAPERLYVRRLLPANGNNQLLRSDDDGASWAETTEPWSTVALPPDTAHISIAGIDADPTQPGRIYVAFNANRTQVPNTRPFLASYVLVSDDAGQTWTDLGLPAATEVTDVQLGIDQQTLFVSTVSGVWLLPLSAGS